MKVILLQAILTWPMPLLWLGMLGALAQFAGRKRLARRMLVLAVLGLFASGVPMTGVLLRLPLTAVPKYDAGDSANIDAIIVPTAGIYQDMAGDWWPEDGTVLRLARGRQLQGQTGLPLIIAGGGRMPGAPPEAQVAARIVTLDPANIRLEGGSRTTAEMAPAVAEMLATGGISGGARGASRNVVLVTSPAHILRSAAVLRAHGIDVVVAVANPSESRPEISGIMLFLPSKYGQKSMRDIVHEYLGIAWYLMRGHIGPGDLFG